MSNVEKREKSVSGMMSIVSEVANRLCERVDTLEQGLVSGLRSSKTSPDTETKAMEEAMCAYDVQLKDILSVLENTDNKVADILERLEV